MLDKWQIKIIKACKKCEPFDKTLDNLRRIWAERCDLSLEYVIEDNGDYFIGEELHKILQIIQPKYVASFQILHDLRDDQQWRFKDGLAAVCSFENNILRTFMSKITLTEVKNIPNYKYL